MHNNSLLIYREHVVPRIRQEDRVLEIGADGNPSTFCREAGQPPHWDTADLASETTSYAMQAKIRMQTEYEIPVGDGAYDVVFSGQVIEHVREIWTWMRELARVTRPGGQVITISPVSWPYHEAPLDCWRIYPDGMRALSEQAGLTVEHCWWGSLEPKPSSRTYPGPGYEWARPHDRFRDRLRRRVGWPEPVAYDMVTVARKPS